MSEPGGPKDPSDPSDFREVHLRQQDFLGAFGVLESAAGILMVQNQRQIAGVPTLVWDLPGGQVEAGERLGETLCRELQEEIGVLVQEPFEFLFYQEGERQLAGARQYVWRSFFFRVDAYTGEPRASGEVRDIAWIARDRMAEHLRAPYHDSFLDWLGNGGRVFGSRWAD